MTYVYATKNLTSILHAKCGKPFPVATSGIHISTWEWSDEDGCHDEGADELEFYCDTCNEKVELV